MAGPFPFAHISIVCILRAKPVFQNEIYWNDWSQLSIFRASKNSGSRMEILVGRLNGIMDMKIFYRGKTTGNGMSA